ncbi:MAG: UvrABC system protein C [Gemmatimonadaceae bacterium]|nr:UvrABC system protein C [Gemmatimonadaceae bacterium]
MSQRRRRARSPDGLCEAAEPQMESDVQPLERLRAHVEAEATNLPGVYAMRSPNGEIIYVGKSKRLRTRLLSYFRGRYPYHKGARIVREAAAIEWSYLPSEFAALLEELRQIKRYRPRFNVALKRDDRNYAFIKLTRGKAPRFAVVRSAGGDERATYYGPFVGAARLRDAVRELSDALGLRDCSHDGRMAFADQVELFNGPARTPGCLRHEIGKCLGPCVAAPREDEYQARVRQGRAFLDGEESAVLKPLQHAMELASERLAYERAAVLRDKLQRLESLRDLFARLRFGVEALTFAYRVPGVQGDDRVYLVRRGRVRAEVPVPHCAGEWESLRDLAGRLNAPTERTSAVPGHEVDELLLLTSWFRARPQELARTAPLPELSVLMQA